ncbi:MAG: hypothetical protein ACRYGP_13840 [Janthinobacterium lividum]
MPDTKPAALVGVTFHHSSPPYEAGDTAGFPADTAARYVASGRAVYAGKSKPADHAPDDFDGMDRKALLAYAREHFGLGEAPPLEISDDEIRDGLRAQAADLSAPAPVATPAAAQRP